MAVGSLALLCCWFASSCPSPKPQGVFPALTFHGERGPGACGAPVPGGLAG